MPRKKINQQALKEIEKLFNLAEKIKSQELKDRYIKIARKIAKQNNIKLPKTLRRKFCHKCNSFFTAKNCKIRINKGKLSIKCLNCNYTTRFLFMK